MAPPAIGLIPMAKAGASIAATTGAAIIGGALTAVGGVLIVVGVVGMGHLAYRVSSHGLDAASKRRYRPPTSSSTSDGATRGEKKPSSIPKKASAADFYPGKTAPGQFENNTLTDASARGTSLPKGKESIEFNAERERKTPLPPRTTQVSVSTSLGGEGDARSETSSPSIIRTNAHPARTGLSGTGALPGDVTGGVNLLNPRLSKSSTPHVPSGTICDFNPPTVSKREPPVDKQRTISSDSSSQVDQDQDATPAPVSHAETNKFSSPLDFTSTADKVPLGSTLRRRARRRGSASSILSIETRNMGITPQTTEMDTFSRPLDTTQLDARLLGAAPTASSNVHTNPSSMGTNTYTQGSTTQTETMSSPRSPGSLIHSPSRPNEFESPWAAFYRSG